MAILLEAATLILMIIVATAIGGLMVYTTNKSRCTLEEAVGLSGCSDSELREIIKEGWLTYRRQYFIFGPHSLDASEIAKARADYAEIKRVRTELDASLLKMAEDAAARIHEANRIYQEQFEAQQEETERMRRIYDEILKNLKTKLGVDGIPSQVVDALQILNLQTDASFDEVRQRYRFLAKQHHPDAGGNPEQFIRINAAYNSVIAWIQSQS